MSVSKEMQSARPVGARRVTRRSRSGLGATPERAAASTVVDDARRAGLLDGDKSEHVSFRAPPALVEAAKRETGVESATELGILALATLAQPDPVAALMKRARGALGREHRLDC